MENKDTIITINGKISKYKCYKKVVSSGGSGAVTLPKSLVGKEVYVEYISDVQSVREEKQWWKIKT